ncbi:MAG: 16S rRNA (guanine(527)-N(7))-methyltransferase RsmG [Cellvibrionaceae bacterium]
MFFDQYHCEIRLREGLNAMEIALDDGQVALLLAYLEAFHKWNQSYNLSAIRDPVEMVTRHLLDSLTLVPYFREFVSAYKDQGKDTLRLIDVGTGGGLPGMPLAIVFPEVNVTLLDSNGKKTRFLFQTAVKLGLKNVIVENNRVEKFSPADKFAIVTSRAFASLQDMVKGCAHLLESEGEFWAMKGLYPESELADCEDSVDISAVHKLNVPHSDGERHLLILKNK